jgi:hypothetical protein
MKFYEKILNDMKDTISFSTEIRDNMKRKSTLSDIESLNYVIRTMDSMTTELTDSVKFNVDNIVDYLMNYETTDQIFDQLRKYVNAAPPFNNIYFEINKLTELYNRVMEKHSDLIIKDLRLNAGVWMRYNDVKDNHSITPPLREILDRYNIKWECSYSIFIQQTEDGSNKSSLIIPVNSWLFIDEHGAMPLNLFNTNSEIESIKNEIDIIRREHKSPVNVVHMPLGADKAIRKGYDVMPVMKLWKNMNDNISEDSLIQTIFGIMKFAITLMHCKNAKYEEKSTSDGMTPRQIKKQTQHFGFAPIKYNVVTISPIAKTKNPRDNSISMSSEKSFHIYRGHFKDFTKGNGLFGKYKGVFWWDSAARGNSSHGININDYEVKI